MIFAIKSAARTDEQHVIIFTRSMQGLAHRPHCPFRPRNRTNSAKNLLVLCNNAKKPIYGRKVEHLKCGTTCSSTHNRHKIRGPGWQGDLSGPGGSRTWGPPHKVGKSLIPGKLQMRSNVTPLTLCNKTLYEGRGTHRPDVVLTAGQLNPARCL